MSAAISASLIDGTSRRSSGTSPSTTPAPEGSGWCHRVLVATVRRLISPVILLATNESGVTSPPTTAEPRPQLASMATTERSPVSGLRVNMTPELRAPTICWTTTAIARSVSGMPRRNR